MAIRKLAALAAGMAFGVLTADPALATTVGGTFAGTIILSRDDTNLFGAGTGNDTVVGQTVTGTFSYVFENVPPSQCGPGSGCYWENYSAVDWMQISVTLNGLTLTVSPGTRTQGIYSFDMATAGFDLFQVTEEDERLVDDPVTLEYSSHQAILETWVVDFQTEIFPGSQVPTSGNWTPGNSEYSAGRFYVHDVVYDRSTGFALKSDTTSTFHWSLSQLSFGIVQVPEPGTMALFGAGLLGLGLLTRRRSA